MGICNTFIEIMVCTPEYTACMHVSFYYERSTSMIDIQLFCFVFWLKLQPLCWEITFFPSSYWLLVWTHNQVGRSGQVPKTGEFWLRKARYDPFLIVASILDKCCPLCALQSEESTSVVQGNKYKRLENLRWIGRRKNWSGLTSQFFLFFFNFFHFENHSY